jgi:hypothetical protein
LFISTIADVTSGFSLALLSTLFSLLFPITNTPARKHTHTHTYKITTSIFISSPFFFFFLFSASSSSLVSQLEPDWRDARELLFPLFFLISKDAKERYCFVGFFFVFCFLLLFLFFIRLLHHHSLHLIFMNRYYNNAQEDDGDG